MQEEWPDAIVSIEDDEEPRTDVNGVSGQAEQDVRDRIEDIVNEVIDSGDWRDEEEDPYEDEEELDDEEEEEASSERFSRRGRNGAGVQSNTH